MKGTTVNHIKRSIEKPSSATGLGAALRGLPHPQGGGAPSSLGARRGSISLAVLCASLLALVLTAAPASAAPPVTFAGPGAGAGQLNVPYGVAVNQTGVGGVAPGTVYVVEGNNNRVDVFDPAGRFEKAFGWGVRTGAAEFQTCTTTTGCQEGIQGEGAGQFFHPRSVAVGPEGSVYVGDSSNSRVEKFDAAGNFVLMFGKGVDHGGGTPSHPGNICTATFIVDGDICGAGASGSGPGELTSTNRLRNEQLVLPIAFNTSGDIWVGDFNRLEQFSPDGEFLSELKLPNASEVAGLAIDSADNFYTLKPRIEASNEAYYYTRPAAGAYTLTVGGDTTASISFSTSNPEIQADLEALPSIGSGNVKVSGSEDLGLGIYIEFVGTFAETEVGPVSGSPVDVLPNGVGRHASPGVVDKRDPSGNVVAILDEGDPNALGFDPATDTLIVSDQPEGGPASFFGYGPSGAQIESFGTGGVLGSPTGNALAFGDSAQALYVVDSEGQQNSAAQIFTLPEPGPLPEEGSAKAEPVGKTTATLKAKVNPEGKETKCQFEYVDQTGFESGGFSNPATKTTPLSASIGEDFSEHACNVGVIGLTIETTYHFRLLAGNENGTVHGEAAAFTTQQPFRIDGTSAIEVSSTGATIGAEVNPLGDPASYHFEYLAQAEYEANGDSFSGADAPTRVPVPDGAFAASNSDLIASRHLSGLAGSTTYVYRIVVSAAAAPMPVDGPTRAFTTEGPGASLTLPDHRAWEMVSPIEKSGGGVSGLNEFPYNVPVRAAEGGQAITWGSPVAFAEPLSSPAGNQYLSSRSASGWSTANLNVPTNSENYAAAEHPPYQGFSPQLSLGVMAGFVGHTLTSTGNALEDPPIPGTEAEPGPGNFYQLDLGDHAYRAIVTESTTGISLPLHYEASTPDFLHSVFVEKEGGHQAFEWTDGEFAPINLLPGKTTATPTFQGLGNAGVLGTDLSNAISTDGSRVVWSAETKDSKFNPRHNLYLRENVGQPQSALSGGKCIEPEAACTVQIDASEGGVGKGGAGTFYLASADGSVYYFADHQRLTPDSTADQLTGEQNQVGDLYAFRPDAEAGHRLTDLTVDHIDPGGAEVIGVVGASEDGSYLYFVANGVLATNEGVSGGHASRGDCRTHGSFIEGQPESSCNLYVFHDGETTYATTVSGHDSGLQNDVASLEGFEGGTDPGLWGPAGHRPVRLTADGTRLVFASYRPLTGYDNTVATGGHCGRSSNGTENVAACPEVFLYRAPSASAPQGQLNCLSCNPTGQRPIGLSGVPAPSRNSSFEEGEYSLPRALSTNGRRVFFDSYDALVPQDTNGKLDVYEWEEPGEGTCEESSPTFSRASGGCVGLISSGTGSENSDFLDASADGSDVFFRTGVSLVKQDPGSVDLYDAREGGGLPEPPPPPASCQGDACQSPPPVPNDPTPSSSTFDGPGNAHEKADKKGSKKHKSKSHKKRSHHKKQKRANANRRAGK